MKYPPITCYPYQADLLSVILNYDKAYPWYINNFVLLESPKKNDFGFRIDFYSTLLWKTCPWIYYQRISRELVSNGWDSIIKFILQSIDLGYYVHFNVNTFYVSAYSDWYGKTNLLHPIFLYGYDDESRILYAADNFKNGKYSYELISYDELILGYNNIEYAFGGSLNGELDWLNGIELINFRDKYGYEFNIESLILDLEDYLQSTNREKKCWKRSDSYWKENCTYGIKIYDILSEYITKISDGNFQYDVRPFHVLWEHKKVMLERLEYLSSLGYLSDASLLYNNYKEIENKCLLIRNLFLKCMMTNKKSNLEKIKIVLSQLKLVEMDLLKTLIDTLKSGLY